MFSEWMRKISLKISTDCFLNKKEAKERAEEKIENNFYTIIKSKLNDHISGAINEGFFEIKLGESYKKYYKLIKKYYKKEKRYKVTKLYDDGIGMFAIEWTGIKISWR